MKNRLILSARYLQGIHGTFSEKLPEPSKIEFEHVGVIVVRPDNHGLRGRSLGVLIVDEVDSEFVARAFERLCEQLKDVTGSFVEAADRIAHASDAFEGFLKHYYPTEKEIKPWGRGEHKKMILSEVVKCSDKIIHAVKQREKKPKYIRQQHKLRQRYHGRK